MTEVSTRNLHVLLIFLCAASGTKIVGLNLKDRLYLDPPVDEDKRNTLKSMK